jgi:dethiobiotin synthetase
VPRLIVITGTDTGAGKTVLATLLVRHLRGLGANAAAIKPICSGSREDAKALRAASENALSLDELNPWHFRAPLAPLLAARKEGVTVQLREVVAHVRQVAHKFDVLIVEGAGGLLSPMGDHFCTRELIAALGADVFISARNQLGIVNHIRLTLEAMPPLVRARARVALMSPKQEDLASRTNPALLAEFIGESHLVGVPWLGRAETTNGAAKNPAVREALDNLLR